MKKVAVGVETLSMSSDFFSKNSFEKFDLPLNLNIDLEDLEQRYFKAQHHYHPDRLRTSNISSENTITDYAAAFNEAYQILKDPLKRADHLLKCLGWLVSDETLGSKQDPHLLTFMMELNEKIEGAITEEEKKQLESFLENEIHHSWQALENSIDKQDKDMALTCFMKLKYLHRLHLNLK